MLNAKNALAVIALLSTARAGILGEDRYEDLDE